MTQPFIREAQLDPAIELGGGAGGAPPDFEIAQLGSPTASYTATVISATAPGSPSLNTTGVFVYVNGIQQAEGTESGSPAVGGNFTYDYGAQTVNFNASSIPNVGDTIALYAVSGVSGQTSGGPAQYESGTYGSPVGIYQATVVDAVQPLDPGENTSIQVFVNGLQQALGSDFTYDYELDIVTFTGSPLPAAGSIVTLNTIGGSVFTDKVIAGDGLTFGSPETNVLTLDDAVAGGGLFISGSKVLSVVASEGILVNPSTEVVELDFINLQGSPSASNLDQTNDLLAWYDATNDLHKQINLTGLSSVLWETGTFSLSPTLSDFSGSPVAILDFHYQVMNGFVVLTTRSTTEVSASGSTTFSATGIPVAIRPTTITVRTSEGAAVDSSASRACLMEITTGGAVTFIPGRSGGSVSWSNGGNKGLHKGACFVYKRDID